MIPSNAKWPAWFPYLSSWLKGAISIAFWVPWFFAVVVNLITYEESNPATEDIGVTIFLILIIAYVSIYAFIEHKVKKSKWGIYLWHGFYSVIVSIIATIPSSFLFMALSREVHSFYGQRIETPKEAYFLALAVYLILAAYLFQFEFCLGQKRANRRRKREEKEAIERELAGMKEEITEARRKRFASLKRTIFPKKKKKKWYWPW